LKQVKEEKLDLTSKLRDVQILVKKTEVELQTLEWNEERVAHFLEALESQLHGIKLSIHTLLSSIEIN
jgi:chromosome segregation ATPase